MSTVPTSILLTAAALDPTVATEPSLDIESIKDIMDAFDPAALLPELDTIFGWIELACRIAVLAGPIVLMGLGLAYLFFSPKEANYYFGYRCYFGMGSVHAWRFTQRIAGIVLGGLGLILTGVMLFLSASFRQMEVMDMVWLALKCLIWEAALAAAATLCINLAAMVFFDRKGEYRRRKKK